MALHLFLIVHCCPSVVCFCLARVWFLHTPNGTVMIIGLVAFATALVVAAAIGQILGLRRRNVSQRAKLLSGLGVENVEAKKVVGFFHPYW